MTLVSSQEFRRLWHATDFPKQGVAVMAGHYDGLLSVGPTLADATRRMLDLKVPR